MSKQPTYQDLLKENEFLKKRILEEDNDEKILQFFQNNKAVMLQIDPINQKIIDANDAALKFYGYTKEEILNLFINEINTLSKEEIQRLITKASEQKSNYLKFKHKLKNNELRDVDVYTLPFMIKGKLIMFSTMYDVTKYKETKHELIQKNKELTIARKIANEESLKFKNIYNNTSDAIVIFDQDLTVITANETLIKLLKLNPDNVVGTKVSDYIVDDNSPELANSRVKLLLENHSGQYEYTLRNSKGETFIAEARGKLITYEGKQAILVSLNDITKRKILEQKILTSSTNAEETERERISKELHDGLGPLLSTCRIYVHNIKNNKDIDSSVNNLEELITESLGSIKEISNNISPHILRNFGVKYALQSFIEKLQNTCDINLEFKNTNDKRYDEIKEITIYRVLIELINNTIKHSQAKNIQIKLEEKNRMLKVYYSDNGIGFDYNKIYKESKGFGLININSRILSIGGKINYFSQENKGVIVNIQI